MKLKFFLSLGVFLLLSSACNTVKYSVDDLPAQQLYFGSGGGFTGAVNEYMLLDNGQIFKHSSGEYTELSKTKKRKAAELYETYYTLKLNELQFQRPGNMYYFLKMKETEGEHFTSWGTPEILPDSLIVVLYDDLMKLVRK